MLGRRRQSDAVNTLSMTEEKRVLGLVLLGWSDRQIARETGHHRATIRRLRLEAVPAQKCTTPAEVPHRPKHQPARRKRPPGRRRRAAPHRAASRLPSRGELNKGRNGVAIYQDCVQHRGYTGSYDAIKRLIRKLRKDELPKISCRFETAPGQEMQVDYGEGALTSRSAHREVSTTETLRAHAKQQPLHLSQGGCGTHRASIWVQTARRGV